MCECSEKEFHPHTFLGQGLLVSSDTWVKFKSRSPKNNPIFRSRQLLCQKLSLRVKHRCQNSDLSDVVTPVDSLSLEDVRVTQIVRLYRQFLSITDSRYRQITTSENLTQSDVMLRVNSIFVPPILTVRLYVYLHVQRPVLSSLLVQTFVAQQVQL